MTSLASRGSHPKELMSFVPKVFEEILTIAPLGKVELPRSSFSLSTSFFAYFTSCVSRETSWFYALCLECINTFGHNTVVGSSSHDFA